MARNCNYSFPWHSARTPLALDEIGRAQMRRKRMVAFSQPRALGRKEREELLSTRRRLRREPRALMAGGLDIQR